MDEKMIINEMEDILIEWNTHKLQETKALISLLNLVKNTESYKQKWMAYNHLKTKTRTKPKVNDEI